MRAFTNWLSVLLGLSGCRFFDCALSFVVSSVHHIGGDLYSGQCRRLIGFVVIRFGFYRVFYSSLLEEGVIAFFCQGVLWNFGVAVQLRSERQCSQLLAQVARKREFPDVALRGLDLGPPFSPFVDEAHQLVKCFVYVFACFR